MMGYTLISIIFSNAVLIRRDISVLLGRSALILLIACSWFCYLTYFIKSVSKGIGLFNGFFTINNLTLLFQGLIFVLSTFIIGLNSFFARKIWINSSASAASAASAAYGGFLNGGFLKKNKKIWINTYELLISKFSYLKNKILNLSGEQFRIIEYPLTMIFVLIGGSLLMSTGDLISIFLSIELQSYGLYLLCTLYRDSELATSGGLMYFLIGGLSSCFILLGSSILYANSGITNLDNLYVVSNLSSIMDKTCDSYLSYYFSFSLLIISVGFLIKISAAPFHFWSPDVYDMIPTIVTSFVAIISKISILIFLLELMFYTSVEFNWVQGVLISSLACFIIGTVLGLTQSRIKKIYAYSSIAHLGFILLCLNIYDIQSIKGFIFYLISYSISNLNGFFVLLAMGFFLYIYVDEKNDYDKLPDYNNSPIQLTSQMKGYFYINPALALSLASTLFSFIGIPPLIGFFAKQMVLNAALEKGYVFMCIVGVVTSVISAVYYLKIINEIFFKKPDYSLNTLLNNLEFTDVFIIKDSTIVENTLNIIKITLSNFLTISISVFTLIVCVFFFSSDESDNFCLFNSVMKFNIG